MITRTLRSLFQALLATIVALALASPAAADPPGRVGRIAWMSGTVQLRNADTGEWNTAVLNYPLTNGDALSTGPGARLEIGIGSTTVRLDSSSELSIDQIDDDRVRLYLASGSATVRLRSRESANEFEMATHDGRFTTSDVGAFRFDHAQNVSSATPYLGTLHFEAEDSQIDIPSGQRAQFWYAGRTAYSFSSPVRDDFSEWSIARDQRQDTRNTRRYVSQEMTGYEDLAANGDWYDSVDYGPVWYPSVVPVGWAPYRVGHWAWVAPWGWTWIDEAPWGFAPFHYGRWVWHRDRWGWAPGQRVARPVYAPALVAWIGTPNVSIGISSGPSVGWFPLAPREVYVPGYRCSPTYLRNVNITHVRHIDNVTQIINDPRRFMERTNFVNRRLPQAVTVVPADVVTQRRPVAPAVEHPRNPRFLDTINRQQPLAQAPVASPPLPPRFDPDRRERDRRGDNPRERRPDGDRPPNERRFAPPGAAPLPAPINANAVPAAPPQAPASQPLPNNRRPTAETPPAGQARTSEPLPGDNPRFNRAQPQPVPGAWPQSAPPAAQPPAPQPVPNSRQLRTEQLPSATPPRAPEAPPPNANPRFNRPPTPAAVPQPPPSPPPQPNNRWSTVESPPAERPRSHDAPSNDNPRFNRPPTPAAVPQPPASPPAQPSNRWSTVESPPVERPRSHDASNDKPRFNRPPQPAPQQPAAMPSQPMPPQRNVQQREQHNPPPVQWPAVRSERMPAAPPSPPQRSQPMPPREAQPAAVQPPQNPRREHVDASQQPQGNQPQNNWRRKGEGERENR